MKVAMKVAMKISRRLHVYTLTKPLREVTKTLHICNGQFG